ncbi:TolC family protein [Pseudoxanthomonas putridarboris]|uniref:TolC family protein n=1 Tax=Pseudoxanthomonas putridarboris TaxID=752605 RepID=A0ABU9J1L6_9GAMM
MVASKPVHIHRNAVLRGCLALAGAACAAHAGAQAPAAIELSFDQASERLQQVSDALRAAEANLAGKHELAEATRHLRLPEVTGELRRLELQKTLELPLGSLAPVAEEYGIGSPLVFSERAWHTRPIVTATLPIYTGGMIPAAQQAADAARRQADAERDLQSQSLLVPLVRMYFGQQLAQEVLEVRQDTREGLDRHLRDATRLEDAGFISRAQRLQAGVARDRGERELERARNDLASIQAGLATLLRAGADVRSTTGLFVSRAPAGSLDEFVQAALHGHPQIARLRAMVEQARQGIRVQQAKLKPQIYAFGQYDFKRGDALLTEPDWVFGIGLKYTFLSGNGRLHQVAAAREQHEQAESALREAENQLTIAVTQSWHEVETTRHQFRLLDSAIEQAQENLRLQELSFREGQATSLDVIDARLALAGARVERLQAAYQYDLALALLLERSGQASRYLDYLHKADEVHLP